MINYQTCIYDEVLVMIVYVKCVNEDDGRVFSEGGPQIRKIATDANKKEKMRTYYTYIHTNPCKKPKKERKKIL